MRIATFIYWFNLALFYIAWLFLILNPNGVKYLVPMMSGSQLFLYVILYAAFVAIGINLILERILKEVKITGEKIQLLTGVTYFLWGVGLAFAVFLFWIGRMFSFEGYS